MPAKRPGGEKTRVIKPGGVVLQPRDRMPEKYILKLYISGMTLRSTRAIENIRRICQEYLPNRCDLEIIDIFLHPSLAKEAQIIAAPTLIKKSPPPLRRMVGDLSGTEKVLSGLNLAVGG